jgi:MIP family channel proteins
MKKYAAEFFGTFCLVFAGTSAIVVNAATGGAITHAGIALVFGLVVLAMVYTIGDVSGAHINPAVTLGFYAAGRLERGLVLPYMFSQTLGAFAATLAVRLILPPHASLGATTPAGAAVQSFALELILTLILMWVILNVSTGAKEKGITAGIAVGAIVALEALFGGPISGASVNPARSLAPAVVSMKLDGLWIYLTAPFLGAVLAVPLCMCVRGAGCCRSPFSRGYVPPQREEPIT